MIKILNIMGICYSGTTLLKTMLCENGRFLNFPEIQWPRMYKYFNDINKAGLISTDEIRTIFDTFYNIINRENKEYIIQKCPGNYSQNFIDKIYDNTYHVFLKRRLIDFSQIHSILKNKTEKEALTKIKQSNNEYIRLYSEYNHIPDNKKIMVTYEDLVRKPSETISSIYNMLKMPPIIFEENKYSTRVNWSKQFRVDSIKSKLLNSGIPSLEKTEKYKELPKEFLQKYLNLNKIISFEESLGTNINEVRDFINKDIILSPKVQGKCMIKILNIIGIHHSGTTLLKTMLCENGRFLNFPEIKWPMMYKYFNDINKAQLISIDEIRTIFDTFYNIINRENKEYIIQKFPGSNHQHSFIDKIYDNVYHVFLKRRLIDFSQISHLLKNKSEKEALTKIKQSNNEYIRLHSDYGKISNDKKMLITYEDLVRKPSETISSIYNMLKMPPVTLSKYSTKINWNGQPDIDCGELRLLNSGIPSLEKAKQYQKLPKEFLQKYLNLNKIISFEESLGTNINEVRDFIS